MGFNSGFKGLNIFVKLLVTQMHYNFKVSRVKCNTLKGQKKR